MLDMNLSQSCAEGAKHCYKNPVRTQRQPGEVLRGLPRSPLPCASAVCPYQEVFQV